MTPRRILASALAAALAAAALLVLPAGSLANFGYTLKGGSETYAQVRGSNGYRVSFSENQKRHFTVRAVGHGTSTLYSRRGGPVAGGGVSADLGKRGSFHLRFVATGKRRPVPVPSTCSGSKGSWQPGYLVGRLRFHGERAYTEVRRQKIPAARESWSTLHCHFSAEEVFGHAKLRRARLNVRRVASGRGGSPREDFWATLFHRHARPHGRRVVFNDERHEAAGGVSITRLAKVEAPESTFRFPGGPKLPEEVEVKPPAPFSGSATFTRTPESTFEWVGDLSVDFPGIDPVRLAGPSFTASVCELGGCVKQEGGGSFF